MATSSSSTTTVFPHRTYAKYKRATSYFLTWLLRTRSGVTKAELDTTQPLEVYDRLVEIIVASPSTLLPAQLRTYPHALSACEVAVTLRSRVAMFFGDLADHQHAHFLDRMKSWLESLKRVYVLTQRKPEAKPLDFSNYYAVLALPDDYFAVEEDVTPVDAPASRNAGEALTAADRKRLNEAFGEDSLTEIACFFMELEELSEGVYRVFHDIKRERKTLVEATFVARVAFDSAKSVIANLQLLYPSLGDGPDLSKWIQHQLSPDQISRLVDSVQAAWTPSEDPAEVRYQYVPGTILVDIVGITRALSSLGAAFRARREATGVQPPLYFVVRNESRYDEARTRDDVIPEWHESSPFVLDQLPPLLNTLSDLAMQNHTSLGGSLAGRLLEPFDMFWRTGIVTIDLVFACIIWVRSVAALQGDRGLSHTVGLAMIHMLEIEQRLGDSIRAYAGNHMIMGDDVKKLYGVCQQWDTLASPLRGNPTLAGCMLLDRFLHYLSIAGEMVAYSLFRPFCHIYSALCDRGFLVRIPFVEEAIQVYEACTFVPSRSSATHGSFSQCYLASDDAYRRALACRLRKPSRESSLLGAAQLVKLSRVVQVDALRDFSGLPETASSSWSALLSAVSQLGSDDLFGSRLLSRDMLKFGDDLDDLFTALCETLCLQDDVAMMVADSTPRRRALECAATFELLPALDNLTDSDIDRADCFGSHLCQQAALVISQKLGPAMIETRYFLFPATPTFRTSIFKNPNEEPKMSVLDEFNALYKMLQASSEPLRGEKLVMFQRRVAATPAVLAIVAPDPKPELWSLLHLAAAGPARDLQLVEWLIQMGAVDRTAALPTVASSSAKCSFDSVVNELAVHSAARKGYTKMVQLMITARNFQDMDTTTLHTKESLSHIAVRTGNARLSVWLAVHGADCPAVDMLGKRVWDLTSVPGWKQWLKQMSAITNAHGDIQCVAHTQRGLSRVMQSVPFDICAEIAVNAPRTISANNTTGAAQSKSKKKRSKRKNKKLAKDAVC